MTSLPLYFTSSLFSFTSTMFHTLHFIYYLHLKLFSLSFPLTLDAFFFFTVFFTSLFTHTFIHAYIHSIISSFVFIHILIHTNYQQSVFDRCSFHFQEGSDLFIVIFWADNILTKQLTFLILRETFHLLYGPCSCCCRNFEQSSFDCDPSSFPTTPRFTSSTTPWWTSSFESWFWFHKWSNSNNLRKYSRSGLRIHVGRFSSCWSTKSQCCLISIEH